MVRHPRTVDYGEVARQLGITRKRVQEAFGEIDEPWFKKVLEAGTIGELWHLVEFIGDENPDKQERILLRILYHTRGENRWDVERFARKRKMHQVVEAALEETLRLSTSQQSFRKIVRHAKPDSEVSKAAIRNYALGVKKHRVSRRHRLSRP